MTPSEFDCQLRSNAIIEITPESHSLREEMNALNPLTLFDCTSIPQVVRILSNIMKTRHNAIVIQRLYTHRS